MKKGQKGGKEEKKKKWMEGVCAKVGETDVEEEEKQEKGMEGVYAEETKKGRMRCGRKDEKEGEGERRKEEKEEQKMEKATQEMHRPLWAHSLARS